MVNMNEIRPAGGSGQEASECYPNSRGAPVVGNPGEEFLGRNSGVSSQEFCTCVDLVAPKEPLINTSNHTGRSPLPQRIDLS